ncbi:hypothetical protein AYJ54_43315 [Bradyrhizobium centrolobii]|uniref:Uncharacterized protein n=2 Tax=Bradyrhizobium centrolobii TaxID=1505087 RepID=A0A176Z003_9BRAD|nr:hypothetical protein AYJ54_43315 [Bradyrhizobium centrolobii]
MFVSGRQPHAHEGSYEFESAIIRIGALLCLSFIIIHAFLLLFDMASPAAFIRGDRAIDRLDHVNQLLGAGPSTILSVALNSGVPGDFLQHAALYAVGGRQLVILCQIALGLFTLILVYRFVARASGSVKTGAATAALIIVMPGGLLNPHLLVTETWFAAFLVTGTVCICLAVIRSSYAYLYLGFASLGLASSVRPQGLLVPLALAAYIAASIPKARRASVIAALLAYGIFPISWMMLRLLLVGDFGLGPSNADLQTNLALRADRILSLPLDTTGRLGLLPFIELAAAHPLALLNTLYTDAFNLVLNPGANHLFGYYLGLGETPDGFSWLKTRDQLGMTGVIAELLRRNGALVALFAVWAAIHATLLFGVGRAGVTVFRAGRRTPTWIWIVLIVIVTTLLSGFAAGLVRWNLRSGVEPLLAILAAYGLLGTKVQT